MLAGARADSHGTRVCARTDVQSLGLARDFLLGLTSDKQMDVFLNTVLDHGFNATLDGPNNLLTIDIFKRFPKA